MDWKKSLSDSTTEGGDNQPKPKGTGGPGSEWGGRCAGDKIGFERAINKAKSGGRLKMKKGDSCLGRSPSRGGGTARLSRRTGSALRIAGKGYKRIRKNFAWR